MKTWVKKLSYFVTAAGFLAGGLLVDSKLDVSAYWPTVMTIVGFVLTAIGGWFVKPEPPK